MENKKNDTSQTPEVLLVNDYSDNKIKAVKGLSENGKLQTLSVNKKNLNQLLKVDKQGDFFSSFFTNFFAQLQNPTEFSFFKVPIDKAIGLASLMQKELDMNQNPTHELFLSHQIDPDKMIQAMEAQKSKQDLESNHYNPYKYNIDDIDWESLKDIGLSKEKLEEMDLLEPLLRGYKTKDLVTINLDLGAAYFSLDARIGLRKEQNGLIVMELQGVKKYPNLNTPLQGHSFTKEDKYNLLKTGNMGRVVELIDPLTNQPIPSVVSVDRLTNNLAVTSIEKIEIPQHIKGVDLSREQIDQLKQGKAVLIEDMTSVKGNAFNAEIQYNASKGHIEFLFDNVNKKKRYQPQNTLDNFRGKQIDKQQREALLQGKSVLIDGLIDKKGNPYKGYITYDQVNSKMDFSFNDPNSTEKQAVVNSDNLQSNTQNKSTLKPN